MLAENKKCQQGLVLAIQYKAMLVHSKHCAFERWPVSTLESAKQ